MEPSPDARETCPPSEVEVDEGRFTILCPRSGTLAELQLEVVSGAVRRFSCSVPGPDDQARRECQSACARWVLGEG